MVRRLLIMQGLAHPRRLGRLSWSRSLILQGFLSHHPFPRILDVSPTYHARIIVDFPGVSDPLPVWAAGAHRRAIGALLPPHAASSPLPSRLLLRLEPGLLLALLQGVLRGVLLSLQALQQRLGTARQ